MKEKILKDLFSLADNNFKEFHGKLCPGTDNIIGIKVPILRSYAKELLKENPKLSIYDIGNNYYEEIMLQGMIIGLSKIPFREKLEYCKVFVPKINNWAICDIFCLSLKDVKKNLELMWDFIQPYLKSKNEFEIRFGIVILLCYYINDNYIDNLFDIITSTTHDGYYVKMSVAWLLSCMYVKYPEKTMDYFKNCNLDIFTYNKALQKIIESNRVSSIDKGLIRGMKKNSN